MKTKAMEYVKRLDNAIEDVDKKYAIETGAKVGKDVYTATMLLGASMLYLGDATIQTTRLTVRSANTGAKALILKAADLYDETNTTVIIRR